MILLKRRRYRAAPAVSDPLGITAKRRTRRRAWRLRLLAGVLVVVMIAAIAVEGASLVRANSNIQSLQQELLELAKRLPKSR